MPANSFLPSHVSYLYPHPHPHPHSRPRRTFNFQTKSFPTHSMSATHTHTHIHGPDAHYSQHRHSHTHTCAHLHTHIHTHTYTHTPTHTHTHTRAYALTNTLNMLKRRSVASSNGRWNLRGQWAAAALGCRGKALDLRVLCTHTHTRTSAPPPGPTCPPTPKGVKGSGWGCFSTVHIHASHPLTPDPHCTQWKYAIVNNVEQPPWQAPSACFLAHTPTHPPEPKDVKGSGAVEHGLGLPVAHVPSDNLGSLFIIIHSFHGIIIHYLGSVKKPHCHSMTFNLLVSCEARVV